MALRTARRLVVAVARLVAPPAEPGQRKAQAASVRSVVESSVHRTSLWTDHRFFKTDVNFSKTSNGQFPGAGHAVAE